MDLPGLWDAAQLPVHLTRSNHVEWNCSNPLVTRPAVKMHGSQKNDSNECQKSDVLLTHAHVALLAFLFLHSLPAIPDGRP